MPKIKKGTRFAAHGRTYEVSSQREDGYYSAKIIKGEPNRRTGRMSVTGIPESFIKKRKK